MEDMPADKWADRAESALPTAHHVGQRPLREATSLEFKTTCEHSEQYRTLRSHTS